MRSVPTESTEDADVYDLISEELNRSAQPMTFPSTEQPTRRDPIQRELMRRRQLGSSAPILNVPQPPHPRSTTNRNQSRPAASEYDGFRWIPGKRGSRGEAQRIHNQGFTKEELERGRRLRSSKDDEEK